MTGAFAQQFDGAAPFRPEGARDPAIMLACADQPAESAVIGALLRNAHLIDDMIERISSSTFADTLLGQVFDAILSMMTAGRMVSPITVAAQLGSSHDLRDRGGARYLAELMQAVAADQGAKFVDHLADLFRRRALRDGLRKAQADVGDFSIPLAQAKQAAEVILEGALDESVSRPALSMAQAWDDTMEQVHAIGAGEVPRGIQIGGLTDWNEITNGMHPGQMVLLGGRPGMGKTAVALAIAVGAARAGHATLFISREMPVEQLMMRIIADLLFAESSSATFSDVQHGRLSDDDRRRAATIRRQIADWPLMFEEPTTLNAAGVGPLIRKHQRAFAARGLKIELVVVDYLGLVDPPKARSNREQEVSDTSRMIKMAARECGVAILALAQLNRGVEQREDKRPLLSDLRDSGSLEQDADTVVFVYRAEYYLQAAEPAVDAKGHDAWQLEMTAARNRVDIYSAKVRNGALVSRKCHFFGRSQAVRGVDFYRTGY